MGRRIPGTNIECGSASFVDEVNTGGKVLSIDDVSPEERAKATKSKEKLVGIREMKKLWKLD